MPGGCREDAIVGVGLGRSGLVGAMLICMALGGCHKDTPAEAGEKEKERAISAASAAARSFFRQFSKPEPSTEVAWGLRGFRAFGPFSWSPDIRQSAAPPQGGDRVVMSSAGLYTATFDVWCSGIDFDGRPAKRKRTLAIDLRVSGDSASVQGAHFALDEELFAWQQYGGWMAAIVGLAVVGHFWSLVVVWSGRLAVKHIEWQVLNLFGYVLMALLVPLYYYPVLIPLGAASVCRLFAHKAARVGATLCYPLHVGLAGWLFFGSWLAVFVPAVLVLLLGALVWAAVAAAETREAERRKAEAAEAAKTRMWDDTETILRRLGNKPWDA